MGVTKTLTPKGEYSVRKRRQPLGLSAPCGIAGTVEALKCMGVTKTVIPKGEYSVCKRLGHLPHGLCSRF